MVLPQQVCKSSNGLKRTVSKEKNLFVDQRHDVRIQLIEHWDVINYYLGMLRKDYLYMYTEVSELSWHLCDSLLFLPRAASNDFCWLAVIKKFMQFDGSLEWKAKTLDTSYCMRCFRKSLMIKYIKTRTLL